MENKNEILICACHSTEHQIVLIYEEETNKETGEVDPMCYAHVHLNKRSFFYRLKYAIKYIFGYKCNYGAFDEFIFNPKDADKIQELVDYLKSEVKQE